MMNPRRQFKHKQLERQLQYFIADLNLIQNQTAAVHVSSIHLLEIIIVRVYSISPCVTARNVNFLLLMIDNHLFTLGSIYRTIKYQIQLTVRARLDTLTALPRCLLVPSFAARKKTSWLCYFDSSLTELKSVIILYC